MTIVVQVDHWSIYDSYNDSYNMKFDSQINHDVNSLFIETQFIRPIHERFKRPIY